MSLFHVGFPYTCPPSVLAQHLISFLTVEFTGFGIMSSYMQ